MTLPSSGPLSLNDIHGEFGGPTPIALGNYYAGGGNVPVGTSGTNGPVPSSGAISIFNFYGTSAAIETQTITVGEFIDLGIPTEQWGYSGGLMGSMSPITSTIYAAHNWGQISWSSNNPGVPGSTGSVVLDVFGTGGYAPNSGWTTVTINGTGFLRSGMTYFQTVVGPNFVSTWAFNTVVVCPFTQTIGAVNLAVFS